MALPKPAQSGAKKGIQDICNAEEEQHAQAAIKTYAQFYDAKFPKAAAKIIGD